MARRPLSAAQKAAIREGLRRYYMSRGQRGAKTVGVRAGAREYQRVRDAEREQSQSSTSPRGQRRAGVTRTDRVVRTVGSLAELRAARITGSRMPPSRRSDPSPAPRGAAPLQDRLRTEAGRRQAERDGLIRRTEDGRWEPTELGLRAMRGGAAPRPPQQRRRRS